MRPLLLATAGHVDHGKSTFIRTLTGVDPDRLPAEKLRGMTLDLGFVHSSGISFIDCPGHDAFIQHAISGHSSVDGACLIVALNEGLCEQTREHARVLQWLGIKKVMVVLTKSDLGVGDPEEVFEQTKLLFSEEIQIDSLVFSKTLSLRRL